MEKKKVPMGHLQKLHINLDSLFKDFELNSQKEISLYVGQNGSGKTLILIFQWLLGCMGCVYLSSGKSMKEYETILQFFFDKSFDNNNFTGKIGAAYDHLEISFEIENGKVKNLDIILTDNTVQVEAEGMPVFMSKTTRLFTDVVKYFKLKKTLNITGDLSQLKMSSDDDLKKLCDFYKLFDILFMERMHFRVTQPGFKIKDGALKSFVETLKKEVVNVTYDDEKCDFIIHEKKDGNVITYSACQLSSGEQAWINMFIQI